jgi:hypothetical protein
MNKLHRFFLFAFNDPSQKTRDASVRLKAFARDERGAIAYLTSLLAGVLLLAAGLAVDYGMAVLTKSKLDNAAQSAVSSGTNAARNLIEANFTDKDGVETKALGEGQQIALDAFDAQRSPETTIVFRSVDFSHVGNTISGQLGWQANYKPQLASMMKPIQIEGGARMIVGIMDIKPQKRVVDEKWSDPGQLLPPTTISDSRYRDWHFFAQSPQIAPTNDARVPGYAISLGGHWLANLGKKVLLYAGNYQLRYWYKSAIIFPEYEPAHICGPTPQSIAWSTSDKMREIGSSTVVGGYRHAARIAAYLHPVKEDPQASTNAPIWHPSVHNRIDICVYSGRWIERVVNLEITKSGHYWLGFSSDAPISATDPRGGWLANVQLCLGTCSDAEVDNFPYAKHTPIFEDGFDATKPEGTVFDGNSGRIAPEARYEVPPSTKWEVVPMSGSTISPAVVTWSKTAPLKDGPQYLLAKFTPQNSSTIFAGQTVELFTKRRLLLTAGRYLLTVSGRGDGRISSGACPTLRTASETSGGSSLCSNAANMPVWREITTCLVVHSTQFYDVGFVMSGHALNGETRADSVKLSALYTNTLRKFSPERGVCNLLFDHQPLTDLADGARLTYDRVIVTTSWWQ